MLHETRGEKEAVDRCAGALLILSLLRQFGLLAIVYIRQIGPMGDLTSKAVQRWLSPPASDAPVPTAYRHVIIT